MLMNASVDESLDWLHDCVLQDLKYETCDSQERTLSLEVDCPQDLGYPPWDGKTLRLTAPGVCLFRYTAWGYVSGLETMDTWRSGVSDATQQDLQRLRALGVTVPPLAFTVSFHSGSFFELVCKAINIEVVS